MYKGKNTYAVGDIHGAFKAFKQALDKSSYKKGDRLILLGDFCDGWSETAQLVEYLIQMKEAGHDCIFIRGNHDVWTEKWLLDNHIDKTWALHGAPSTIDSYISTGLLEDKRHHAFFRNLVNYYIDAQNRLFVHGGFISPKGCGYENDESVYYYDRTLWGEALSIKRSNTSDSSDEINTFRHGKHTEIYIGHTPTTNYIYRSGLFTAGPIGERITTPMHACNVWNLDTGCAFIGKCTIMNIDTKEYWQSESALSLYPGEKGRNP